ncbi:cytochrome c3 family protein [Aquirufa sp. LEOWEIH-7C]|uniref:Cytochrome c3 family protein n=1 Tax=Aquirufa regiilacus TaxID=3024868 RepID=A0ABU3TV63_9BACT|nr:MULTISPECIES: cytochrome c3 family protein [unclassified Aquirufa]MDT8888218.1 cytochrome c3 family protein [Aquirufa sp. LEPPI-3A]MDU0809517.1 cytochrome c3 family protein [Aquirufa sp. LEOWEIH-7C]
MMFCKKSTLVKTFLSFAILLASVSATFAQDAAEGETLFKNNCAACHNTSDEVLVGPGLKGIGERRPIEWIVKWVHNPQAVIASGDKYANDLYNKFNKAAMTPYPNFTDAQIKSIVAYVDASNAAPAAPAAGAAPAADGAAAPAAQSSGGMLEVLLVGLLIIMVLVLIALLSIVSTLGKITKGEASEDNPFMQRVGENLKAMAANSSVKTGILVLALLLGGKATIDAAYGVGIHQGYAPEQPIKFSHKLHAGQNQINCNYCHTGVYEGKGANVPSANICMNCHNAIKRESPEIQKIYRALENNEPIQWVRVHNLPDLAYFNHSQHTNVGGLECKNCHGEIEKMEVVEQRSSLTMGWCIDCHRETDVNAKGNAYYDKLVEVHNKDSKTPLKVQNIGGLECSKCHY